MDRAPVSGPQHDRRNSLSIGVGDEGQVLIHCHAGHDAGMVLYHKGLQFKDLFPPRAETVPSNGAGRRPSPEPSPDPLPRSMTRQRRRTRASSAPRATRSATPPAPRGGPRAPRLRRRHEGDALAAAGREYGPGRRCAVETLPLFGIHRLGDPTAVFVVEGEGLRGLAQLGAPAVGTVTGAGGCPGDDSLRPLVGRTSSSGRTTTTPASSTWRAWLSAWARSASAANRLFRFDGPTRRRRATRPISWRAVGRRTTSMPSCEARRTRGEPRPAAAVPASSTAGPGAPASASGAGLTLGASHRRRPSPCDWRRQGDAECFTTSSGDTFCHV